jgi:DNA-binding CsgD family transcriptional regulator
MNPFTLQELRQLNDLLVELYSTHDLVSLVRKSIGLIRRFVPGDMTIYALTDPRCPEVAGIFEPAHHELPGYTPQYMAFNNKHPIMLHFYRTRDFAAIRFEDAIGRRELENLDLYNEFFKPLKIHDMLAIVHHDEQGREIAIATSRDRRFSERDRRRLEALRPHISRAFSNAGLLAQLGRQPFSPALLLREPAGSMRITRIARNKATAHLPTLTSREIEILRWISDGKTNPEIAITLGISPRTVQKHVEHLFVKLNVSSRTGAAMCAVELGISNSKNTEQLIQRESIAMQQATAPRLMAV